MSREGVVLLADAGHMATKGRVSPRRGRCVGVGGRAIVAALVMLATDWYLTDQILSAGIGSLIAWSSWRLLRESVDVLLEPALDDMDSDVVRSAMAGVDGVDGVSDLQIWTVISRFVSLSAHVELTDGRQWEPILLDP